jgi:hypothetical protein
MCDITAQDLARMMASLDRIEDMLTGLTEPAPRLRDATRPATPRPEPETRLAEVIPIAAARK